MLNREGTSYTDAKVHVCYQAVPLVHGMHQANCAGKEDVPA
jgi:hypothetical protein